MALQIQLEFCSLCLRNIAERRRVKGSILLKHSGSSASEVADFLIGEKLSVITLCFRCYRLILGTDYHQHEFKKLKDSLVKIYTERCVLVEKSRNPGCDKSAIESSRSFAADENNQAVEEPFASGSELSIPPLPSDLNDVDLMRYRLQDCNLVGDGISVKPGNPKQDVEKVCVKKIKVRKVEQVDLHGQKRYIAGIHKNVCGMRIRSSKRRKRVKKSEDFEYYADASKDLNASCQSESSGNVISGAILNDPETKKHCPLCSKDFAVRKDYINHPCMQVVEKNILRCKGCQMSFSVRQHYMKHIDACYKNVSVKCHICSVELQSAAYLPRHLEAFHNGAALTEKSSLCDQCGRTFSRKEALQRHQAKVHGISHGTHQCAKCGQTFLHTSLLMEHVRAHKGYACPQCGKVFSCRSNLTIHKQTFHLNKTLYFCSPCNKRWRFHASYTNHMRKVHGSAQFKCSKCKLLFSAENAFERHKEVCVDIHKKLVVDKYCSGTKPPKRTKKPMMNIIEAGLESHASENRIDVPIGPRKVSDVSCNINSDRNYVRLKRIVRKVPSSIHQHVPLPPEDIVCVNRKSSKMFREIITSTSSENNQDSPPASSAGDEVMLMPSTSQIETSQLMSHGASVSSSSEIVLETIEDFSTDCQYVILVEDGNNDQK